MKCKSCSKTAISDKYCEEHFIKYFENTVKKTIKDYNLFSKKDKICVAASGGKDSMALLYLLHKLNYDVNALALDEGIENYRDKSLEFLKKFCKKNKIKLRIYSYKKEVGSTVDKLSKKYSPACNICGTFRRHLLDKYSKGFDKVVTGHNLDDESQAVLMNLLKAQTAIFSRQGPLTKKMKGFVQKAKPFYFLKEKEVMIYAFLHNLTDEYEECPYAHLSFRAHVRDLLNAYESKNPGTKLNIVKKYLFLKNDVNKDEKVGVCSVCKSPCSGNICKACRYKKEINRSL